MNGTKIPPWQEKLAVLLTIISLGGSAIAADSRNITQIGRELHGYGVTNRLALFGNQVALASGLGGLQMVDCSDPENPRVSGFFDDNKYPMVDVAVRGEFIYGLYSTDQDQRGSGVFCALMDEENPRAIGRAARIGASANHLIMTPICGVVLGADVALVDLSNAFEPAYIGRIPTSALDAAWIGDHLYLLQASGVAIYDVEDPANPPQERAAFFDHAGSRAITIKDSLLCLTDQEGFKVFSIRQPHSPELLGSYNEADLYQFLLTENNVIITGSRGLLVISLADPTRLEVIYHDQDNHCTFRDMVVADGILYALIEYSTLVAYDVTDPGRPTEILHFYYGNQTLNIKDIETYGNYLYVCDASYLSVWDISHPFDIRETGGYLAPMSITDYKVNQTSIFAAVGSRGIRILSLDDPRQPQAIAYLDSIGSTTSLCLKDTLLYVATSDSGVRIVNVSNPENPFKIGRFPATGYSSVSQIVRDGDRLYLRKNQTVQVLHIAENGLLDTLRTLSFAHTVNNICVSGDLLFIVESNARNRVYNISNLDTVRSTQSFNPPGLTRSMFARGNQLFIADGAWGGIRTYEITAADTLIETGYYDTPGDAYQVAVSGNLAFVAGLTNFSLYDCSRALTVYSDSPLTPVENQLLRAYPAPFNQFLTIDYTIPVAGVASISVFDPLGRRIGEVLPSRWMSQGSYHTIWRPSGVASGPVFIRLDLNGRPATSMKTLQVK